MTWQKKLYHAIRIGARAFLFAICLSLLSNTYAKAGINETSSSEIEKIVKQDKASFSFAVIGDVQINFKIFNKAIDMINEDPEIAFLVINGDMMAESTREGYEDALSRIGRLRIPVLASQGNHDILKDADGNLFAEYMGKENFMLPVGSQTLFVFLSSARGYVNKNVLAKTNDLMQKLKKKKGIKHIFIFSHVPPIDPRTQGVGHSMGKTSASDFFAMMENARAPARSVYLINSHIHGFFDMQIYPDEHPEGSIRHIITGGGGGALVGKGPNFFHHYVKIRIVEDNASIEVVPIKSTKKTGG